jgi:hypothetical protein
LLFSLQQQFSQAFSPLFNKWRECLAELLLPHKPCQASNNCPRHHNSRLHRQPAAPDAWAWLDPWVCAIIVQCKCRRHVAASNTGCYSALLHAPVATNNGAHRTWGWVSGQTTTGFKNRQLWPQGPSATATTHQAITPSPPDATETTTPLQTSGRQLLQTLPVHTAVHCAAEHMLFAVKEAHRHPSPRCASQASSGLGGIGLHLAL